MRRSDWGPQEKDPRSARAPRQRPTSALWANFCDKTLAEVRFHSACWATVNPPRPAGVHERTTRERWEQIHDLLGKGVGLLECARRLNLSRGTVKRYARTHKPEASRRAPRYRPTLVDPYRDHLRDRRATDPAVPVQQLFREIKDLGYTGSLNLLYRYITQGRAEGERPVTTPRRLARLLLTHPDRLRDSDTRLVQELTAACPELTDLAHHVRDFAALLTRLKATTTSSPPGSPPSASPIYLTCTASPTGSSLTAPP